MNPKDTTLRIVADARPLAALLQERGRRPLLPALTGRRACIVYNRRILDETKKVLLGDGLGAGAVAELIYRLERWGERADATAEVQVYADAERDEGLRLAVATAADLYVTEDDGVAVMGNWKRTRCVTTWEEVWQELLSGEETAVAFRARSEPEAVRVAAALEDAGLEAYVAAQQVPWYDGVLAVAQGYWGDVVVFRKDLSAAAKLIEKLALD